MDHVKIDIPADSLRAFCVRWKIVELSLFGSSLREDFGPDSDVDVCVVFDQSQEWSLFDIVTMREELVTLFGGRSVDIIELDAMRNPFFRHRVLTTRKVVYAA